MIDSDATQGDLMRPFPFSFCCAIYGTNVQLKLNGLGKTHLERIFNVELKLKLRLPFHYEQIV